MKYAAFLGLVVLATSFAFSNSGGAGEKKPASEKDGWRSLFDGKTLAGWKSTNFGGEAEVEVKDGAIIMDMGNDMTGVTFTGKDFPKMNYEFTIEGKRLKGNDFFCTCTFPFGDSHCSLVTGGWGGAVVGISSLDMQDASENETTSIQNFKDDTWYKFRVRVTKERIQAWIDEKNVVDVSTKDRKVTTRVECDLSKPFGIATWRTTGAVRNIQVRELPK
jgi:hypothetical protein